MEDKVQSSSLPPQETSEESNVVESVESGGEMSARDIEKQEEEKLKSKYSFLGGGSKAGHSVFLQKKLTKGQKFFDSGDYQMAKQTGKAELLIDFKEPVAKSYPYVTGGEIPTPSTVPARKTSIIQPNYIPPCSSNY